MGKFLALIIFFLVSAGPAFAEDGRLSLGLGYPYLSLKYDFKALAVAVKIDGTLREW